MSYRNVFIASPAKLYCKNNQLLIKSAEEYSVPIEDISCLLIENLGCTISAYTLSMLSGLGTTVLFCDNKHMPSGVMMPLNRHSRQLKILKSQLKQSKPFLKRLWQQIIKMKINNQARCLEFSYKDGAEKMIAYAKNVKSGDTNNIESRAASYYFKKLYGDGFSRGYDNIINGALNYGYAIIRGSIARQLASYGFEPTIGINHDNEQNNFNLADDLIEPFRPVVDLYVANNLELNSATLTPYIKQQLFNILNCSIISDNQKHSVAYAIERTVKSLSNCFTKEKGKLILPELIPLKQHAYE